METGMSMRPPCEPSAARSLPAPALPARARPPARGRAKDSAMTAIRVPLRFGKYPRGNDVLKGLSWRNPGVPENPESYEDPGLLDYAPRPPVSFLHITGAVQLD